MEKIPSIFNDVLSPVTPGPSSSNTCGPFRIAALCRQLLGEKPLSLTMTMAEDGGYKDTFYSMQSDLGSIAGILGKDFLTYPLTDAYADAEKEGLQVKFTFIKDMAIYPSEMAEITVSGETRTITLTAISWGGGEIEISAINGCQVYLDGKSHTLITFTEDGVPSVATADITAENAEEKRLSALTLPSVSHAAVLSPVFPFGCAEEPALPFTTAAELFQLAKSSGRPLWEIGLQYEKAVTGADEDALWAYLNKIYDISLDAMEGAKDSDLTFEGVTTPKGASYSDALKTGKLIPLGAADQGCLNALRIMEFSNSHGQIVCMPTGGASGIIPAAILNTAEALGLSKETQLQALLTAGLIGLFYYPTHYSGAIGCQAEIGVAISMAAGALASMISDDPDVIEGAASLGGQSVMGMVCNPVDGYVQVPCILRNMTAVPTAMVCANAAAGGLEGLIPLDKVVDLMLKVGEKIRPCNQAGTYYTCGL